MNTAATPLFLRSMRDWLDCTLTEPGRFDVDPQAMKARGSALLCVLGETEGARCKSWGLTTRELWGQVGAWAGAFDLIPREATPFRLPFAGFRLELALERDGSPSGQDLLAAFLGGVFSAYGLKAVRFAPREPGCYEVVSGATGEGAMASGDAMVREFVHSMNNRLGGVTAFVSLLRRDPGNAECIQGISDAVDGALDLMRETFSKRPAAGGEKG